MNSEPAAGAAVKVTLLPASSEAEQVAVQSMVAGGFEVTLPEPVPARFIESWYLVPASGVPPPEPPPQAIIANTRGTNKTRGGRKKVKSAPSGRRAGARLRHLRLTPTPIYTVTVAP